MCFNTETEQRTFQLRRLCEVHTLQLSFVLLFSQETKINCVRLANKGTSTAPPTHSVLYQDYFSTATTQWLSLCLADTQTQAHTHTRTSCLANPASPHYFLAWLYCIAFIYSFVFWSHLHVALSFICHSTCVSHQHVTTDTPLPFQTDHLRQTRCAESCCASPILPSCLSSLVKNCTFCTQQWASRRRAVSLLSIFLTLSFLLLLKNI